MANESAIRGRGRASLATFLAGAALAAAMSLTPQAAQAAELITGRSGSDAIIGTDGADTIYGYGGSDGIVAGAGDDTVYPGRGADTVSLGDGDDRSFSRDGTADRIRCGNGFDRVSVDLRDRVADDCERVSRG